MPDESVVVNISAVEWVELLADAWARGYRHAVETCPYSAPHGSAFEANPYLPATRDYPPGGDHDRRG